MAKKALVLAHDSNLNLDYRDISANIKGFAANLLKSSSIGTSTNTAIVSDLEKGSTTLADISQQFGDKARDMIIYTFYETERLSKLSCKAVESSREVWNMHS